MKYFSISLLIALSASRLPSQALHFHRIYPAPRYTDVRSILPSPDGGFVCTGLDKNGADSTGSMYLTKINAAGAVVWSQTYLRPQEDGGNHLLATADGGYLLTGHTALSYGELCDGLLIKTDALGREQWRSLIGGALDDVCDAALELPDGSFLVAGRSQEPDTRTFRMLLAKVNSLGVVEFQKLLPTETASVAYAMTLAPDGNPLLAGYAYGGSSEKMLAVKCDTDGKLIWAATLESDENRRANAVVALPDGGCVIVGGENDADGNYSAMVTARFDSEGRHTATGTVLNDQGTGYLYAATATAEGRIAVAGTFRATGTEHGIPVLAVLDDELQLLKWHKIDLPEESRTRCLCVSTEGGFALAGNTLPGSEQADCFVATIAGESATLHTKDAEGMPVLLFPNPFSDYTYVKAGSPGDTHTLSLTDGLGRRVRTITYGGNEYFLQRGDLPAGMYGFIVRKTGSDSIVARGKIEVR